jgi:hypothetical protein
MTDVNQTAEVTATTPSSSEQTTFDSDKYFASLASDSVPSGEEVKTPEQEKEKEPEIQPKEQPKTETLEEEKKVSDHVPYDRFKGVNEENKLLKKQIEEITETLKAQTQASQKIADSLPRYEKPMTEEQKQEALAKEELKKLGFYSKDEIDQIISERLSEVEKQAQEKIMQKEADSQLEKELITLEAKDFGEVKFDRKEVLNFMKKEGILNPESAFKLLKHDLLVDQAIKQAIKGNKGVKSEASDGSGATAQQSDKDLISRIKKGDKEASDTYFSRLAQ